MSEPKFTPGPWTAQWICNNDWTIAGPKPPTYMSGHFTESDARLIAAAPELYEALRACMCEIRDSSEIKKKALLVLAKAVKP